MARRTYYIVYKGLQRYRNGKIKPRIRVRKIRNVEGRPKIVDKRIGGVNLKNPLMPDEYEVKFIIVRFILRMNISEKAKNHIFLLSME